MSLLENVEKVDIITEITGTKTLRYHVKCPKCGTIRTFTQLKKNSKGLCYDCKEKEYRDKAKDKMNKERQKVHYEAQKIAMMYAKSLIHIVKTTPSAPDVITDRNKLIETLENYKLAFFEEGK